MFIPMFALRQREREILKSKLNRTVKINLKESCLAYVVEDSVYEEIIRFVEGFREGIQLSESDNPLNEATPAGTDRSAVLRAVTTIFNIMVDVQKIKDPDTKTAAMAGILSSIMSVYTMAPEYGNRLISMFKSKV